MTAVDSNIPAKVISTFRLDFPLRLNDDLDVLVLWLTLLIKNAVLWTDTSDREDIKFLQQYQQSTAEPTIKTLLVISADWLWDLSFITTKRTSLFV